MTYDIDNEFSESGFVQMGKRDFRDSACDKCISVSCLDCIVSDAQALEENFPLFDRLQRHVKVDRNEYLTSLR